MLRAALKGLMLFGFDRFPGGARAYRELTRCHMGTQATHVDKLRRVWPGYVRVWTGPECGLCMDGLDVWVHEAGWTPFPLFANYLTTGKGGVITNSEARLLDRYLSRAVNGALETDWPRGKVPEHRRQAVEPLRWAADIESAIGDISGMSKTIDKTGAVPLTSASRDLCHSGGALEHYSPDRLSAFLGECYRVLRPGGIASHVFDHRDHLHHADKGRQFLDHLRLSDVSYTIAFGHPLTYHNRLLPCEVAALFDSAGFERIAVRRMILPQREYVLDERVKEGQPGIARVSLARRFRDATDDDLRTAAAHYLYRKPLI